jgi:hypothetical protein
VAESAWGFTADCCQEPFSYDIPALQARIRQTPFKEAFGNVWRIQDVEGVFANFLANSSLARGYTQLGLP